MNKDVEIEKYYLINKDLMKKLKKEYNYKDIELIMKKYNITNNDNKSLSSLINNLSNLELMKYFGNKDIKKKFKIENNQINQKTIYNITDICNVIKIYDNFELIEKDIIKLFIDDINKINDFYLECTINEGKIIIHYPDNFVENQYSSVIGKINKDYSFITEYILIYKNKNEKKTHLNKISEQLNHYLNNLQLFYNTEPILKDDINFEIIGTIIKYDENIINNKLNINNNYNNNVLDNNMNNYNNNIADNNINNYNSNLINNNMNNYNNNIADNNINNYNNNVLDNNMNNYNNNIADNNINNYNNNLINNNMNNYNGVADNNMNNYNNNLINNNMNNYDNNVIINNMDNYNNNFINNNMINFNNHFISNNNNNKNNNNKNNNMVNDNNNLIDNNINNYLINNNINNDNNCLIYNNINNDNLYRNNNMNNNNNCIINNNVGYDNNYEIIELREQLNLEKMKNKKLSDKIITLENELKLEKNKTISLNEKINQLNIELNNQLKKYKDLTNNTQNQSLQNINMNYSKESLYQTILEKDKEIKELRIKLSRYPFELNEGEKLMTVNFQSFDQKLKSYSIICKNTDIFNNIEKKLYEDNREYYDTENYFTVNGNRIHKLKSLDENKINNNDIIILNIIDI